MQKIDLRLFLSFILVFILITTNAQTIKSPPSKTHPYLTLKIPYQVQLQAKVKEIEKNNNLTKNQLGKNMRLTTVHKNFINPNDFMASYQTKNAIVASSAFPGMMWVNYYKTYLRIGEYRDGLPPIKDQVVSVFFDENDQSFLISDKDFTNIDRIYSLLGKDLTAMWGIEPAGTDGFKISTGSTKKYLNVKRTGGNGTETINLTTDKNDLGTNWVIYCGAEDGITFYNTATHVFLGRKVVGRKIFLMPLSYKEYGNDALRKVINISWDLYYMYKKIEIMMLPEINYEEKYAHSFRYMITRPPWDGDGDGHGNMQFHGDDCDDSDPSKYPGNYEICDTYGHNEDCNDATAGFQDIDGDGYNSSSCFQLINGVITAQGEDCDDSNPAIYPGQQIFVNERTVDVCGMGLFEVENGYIAVRQPNGTAIVIPKNN